ncbi:efflux RND transporter periplasmic adaptor subunit [Vibrio nereis]|uniref:efflux RND transporter periplasmic adaptor subunit n=1 Tax=Vibrio nereis TaxID=693 RepID=UPI003CD0D15C
MKMNKLRTRQPAYLLAIAVLTGALVGCDKANSEIVESQVITPVKLMEVIDSDRENSQSFIAEIDATERATLSFQVSGQVEAIKVKMGQMVKQGDLLALLDATDYQIAVNARQAEYDLAKTAFERAEALFRKKLVSADMYDQHETNLKAAKAALDQAITDLEYTKIEAPFDGVVSIVFSKNNQVVGASEPVLNLIDNNTLDVVFTVPVTYIEQNGLESIANSQLLVEMDSHTGLEIPAEFKEISTQPESDTNSYTASATIQRPQGINLLPGMTGLANLQHSERKPGFTISRSAWVSKQDTTGELYRFDDEKQTITKVQVNLDESGRVISGIEAGDLIVQAGVDSLVSGQQVKAWVKEGGI